MTYQEKLERFAALVQEEYQERLIKTGLIHGNETASKTTVIPGKKYAKVDVGASGKYMVDAEGNIFGIKAYGVIHRGHQYGTLDTVDAWYWGGYEAVKKPLYCVNKVGCGNVVRNPADGLRECPQCGELLSVIN